MMVKSFSNLLVFSLVHCIHSLFPVYSNNLAWTGGPLHLECDLTKELLTQTGKHVRENVIAIKAVSFQDRIFVLTPRLKHGVVSTVSEVVRGRRGPELQPYPDLHVHTLAKCQALQNAVDFHLDTFGQLWVLDSGIVETMEAPRCVCPPKVVAINLYRHKTTHHIDLSSLVEPTSLLQNIVTDYGFGTKPYVYISDASRGAVLVHDMHTASGWTTLICSPAAAMQLAVVKRAPAHATLLVVRIPYAGILELNTGSLRRRQSHSPIRVFGDHSAPVLLLGTDSISHKVFMRYKDGSEVLFWNVHDAFNTSNLITLHSPSPRLVPTSVNTDPLRPSIVILDSNYAESIQGNLPTYHRLTILSKF